MNEPSLKELVKMGKLDAKSALDRLWVKSDTGMGGTGTNMLKKTKTFKWLSRKVTAVS